MTLLIDTHALLWWLASDRRLARRSRERIVDPENRVLASAVSAWEVAVKKALGKLAAPDDLLEAVEASGLEWISIAPSEALTSGSLPMHHRDPFDRLLIAQAMQWSAHIISHDEAFDRYRVRRVWS